MEDGAGGRFGDLTVEGFVDRLASADPVPGGGSASAVAAALAAGLVAMVARLSEGRPKYAAHAALAARSVAEAEALADRCLRLAVEDAAAYAGFATSLKLPRDTDAEREARAEAIRGAARSAALVPLDAVEVCRDIVAAAERLAGRSNANASSDLRVAALLAEAAADGAAANVLVNLPATEDPAFTAESESRVAELIAQVRRLAEETREVVRSGMPRDPLPESA
jgi:glutamate formiminotransferase/formiminotetrahydrofolate cyclodeaminase